MKAFIVFFVLLPLNFLLGVPTTTVVVARKTWKVWAVFAGILAGSSAGFLPKFGGPAGIPAAIFWPVVVGAAALWLYVFVRVTVAAWKAAWYGYLDSNRM
jgi:hypothetical protein